MTVSEFAQDILFRVLPELENKTTYGFINKNKEQTIGIYERQSTPVNCYGKSSYSIKRFTILVHWSKSQIACEAMANKLAEKLNRHKFTNGWIELDSPPIDVGRDENEIFERTLNITIYNKEE